MKPAMLDAPTWRNLKPRYNEMEERLTGLRIAKEAILNNDLKNFWCLVAKWGLEVCSIMKVEGQSTGTGADQARYERSAITGDFRSEEWLPFQCIRIRSWLNPSQLFRTFSRTATSERTWKAQLVQEYDTLV
jgi:hypothetical protein